jgi:glucose-6-phosphate 1-epimerase
MQAIDDLNKQFAIPEIARFEPGGGGLPRLTITAPAAEGHIYPHGGHVTHFQPRGQKPVLFLSPKSAFEEGKPIRGGVPVIFPWFGPRDGGQPGPMHGVARLKSWDVREVKQAGEHVRVILGTKSDEQTLALWPNDFELTFAVTFGPTLEMILEVRNTSKHSWKFEEALHTYYAVGDVRQASVEGLGGTTFIDKVQNGERRRQDESILKMTGQTDRVYVNTKATCIIDDAANGRKIRVAKENSNSTVVWNPWDERIRSMADFQEQDWPHFLCVETCNARDGALELAAGASHKMSATISVQT